MDDYREQIEEFEQDIEPVHTIVDATQDNGNEFKIISLYGKLHLLRWNEEHKEWDEFDNMTGKELLNQWVNKYDSGDLI